MYWDWMARQAISRSITISLCQTRGGYHGGRQPSRDDSLHSPTVIPPSALDKLSIVKCYCYLRTTRWGVAARSPTLVTLCDTRFVRYRWWNDGWTVKTVITWQLLASIIPAPGLLLWIIFTCVTLTTYFDGTDSRMHHNYVSMVDL